MKDKTTLQNRVLQALMLVCMLFLASTEARKTYAVKETINAGNLTVHSPRVMANDIMWCFLKDENNDYCIEADLNWKVEFKTEQEFKDTTTLTTAPHFNYTFSYQTTQSGVWLSRFNMKKLIYHQTQYTMNEFTFGLKYQFYYWYDDQAVCLNFAGFITPTDFSLTTALKMEQCSRVLIKCFDNWKDWLSVDQKLLGTCALSSEETVTMYKYAPIENELTHYYMGNDTYMQNFCWPGPTPVYSNLMRYPNNPGWAMINIFKDLQSGWMAAYNGLPSNNPAFQGPVKRRAWDEIYADTKNKFTGFMDNFYDTLYKQKRADAQRKAENIQ